MDNPSGIIPKALFDNGFFISTTCSSFSFLRRIHRLGQQKDVHIYNFAVNDTVEQNILSLLYEKIHLFESVIGELDDILTKMDLPKIEDYIQEALDRKSVV